MRRFLIASLLLVGACSFGPAFTKATAGALDQRGPTSVQVHSTWPGSPEPGKAPQ